MNISTSSRLRQPGLILFMAAILLSWLCLRLDFTPAQASATPSDTTFSVDNAFGHLRQIARKPHSTGTEENARVREYILATCRGMGLETKVDTVFPIITGRGGVLTGTLYNVMARIKGAGKGKGTGTGKKVLVMSHYDSEPNAVGAGDDGSGCVSMLEVARIIKTGPPLGNDVIFLFTAGEEEGLLGATGFFQQNPLVKEIGVVLNFDARGSKGRSYMFRTNTGNCWVIGEYAHSGAHTDANSLFYELFKLLPNDTDFSPFQKAGLTGLDFAFIDGFQQYHSMTDIPDNLDRNSLQGHGDNMLAVVRQFGKADLQQTTAPSDHSATTPGHSATPDSHTAATDDTFFNLIGDTLVCYPASLNMPFLVLANILLLVLMILVGVRRKIGAWHWVVGILAFPLVLILLHFVSHWTLEWILSAHPLYGDYYPNLYDGGYFYFALTALAVFLFTGVYQWLLRKWSMHALVTGVLLLEVVLLDIAYTFIPTAIYFLCFPVLFFEIGCLITFNKRDKVFNKRDLATESRPWRSNGTIAAFLIPAILLLTPVCYSFFIAFDLQQPASFIAPLIGLLLGLFLPLLANAFTGSRWLIPSTAFVLFLLTMSLGFLNGGNNERQPMKTDLRYLVNADEGKAWWVSHFQKTDSWNRKFFANSQLAPTTFAYPSPGQERRKDRINTATLVNLPAPTLTIKKDTVTGGNRKLTLQCLPGEGALSVHISFDLTNPCRSVSINGRSVAAPVSTGRPAVPADSAFYWLDNKGTTAEGFEFTLSFDANQPINLDLVSRKMGLPAVSGFSGYPAGIIPGPGPYSNTTMVTRHYKY